MPLACSLGILFAILIVSSAFQRLTILSPRPLSKPSQQSDWKRSNLSRICIDLGVVATQMMILQDWGVLKVLNASKTAPPSPPSSQHMVLEGQVVLQRQLPGRAPRTHVLEVVRCTYRLARYIFVIDHLCFSCCQGYEGQGERRKSRCPQVRQARALCF